MESLKKEAKASDAEIKTGIQEKYFWNEKQDLKLYHKDVYFKYWLIETEHALEKLWTLKRKKIDTYAKTEMTYKRKRMR